MSLSTRAKFGAAAVLFLLGSAVALFAPRLFDVGGAGLQSMEYLTPPTLVEQIYPSMLGPENTDLHVRLSEQNNAPELLWVTGYQADMVGPDTLEPRSAEFMCHNTLSFHQTTDQHTAVMGSGFHLTRRLFTLSQGQSSLHFPEGFGIPVSSAESFMLQSQVLNLREDRIGQQVRHRVRTDFVADREAKTSMTALTLVDFGIGLEVVDKQAQESPDNPLSCAGDAGGQPTFHGRGGKEMTAHWLVKPGAEERITPLPKPFRFNTKIHYISVHMHSYGESLELRDTTDNTRVFLAECKPTPDGQGLAEVTHYSSVEGLPVYASHRYELISRYNNTSDEEQTAMAFMFCYVADPYFEKPDPTALAQRSDEFCRVPEPVTTQP